MVEHEVHSLRRTSAGGLDLATEGGEKLRLQPAPSGLRVEPGSDLEGWLLARGDQPSDGFILLEADGETEAGRTMAQPGAGREPDLRYLLISDGCLYRIKLRGPHDGRYELQGWEAPGAYLTARPGSRGWTITPEPAASGLQEIRPLVILFAAEILDSEEPLAGG